MEGRQANIDNETLLSYLLNSVQNGGLSSGSALDELQSARASNTSFLSTLRSIADAATVLTSNLEAYSEYPASDHKLVSILRQRTALTQSLHVSEQQSKHRVSTLAARDSDILYGEPIPLDNAHSADWSLHRIEQWGRRMGMEIFRDEEKNGRTALMLGGKVLALEVDFAIQRNATGMVPRVSVMSVKTSYALSPGNAQEKSTALNGFIHRTWNAYFEEIRTEGVDSNKRAARLAKDIQKSLSYLMKLDFLASKEGDQGARWFNDLGLIHSVAEQITKTEANALAPPSMTAVSNLDVFLLRAHALPLPCLEGPSMSFLVHLSPQAYYSLLTYQTSPNIKANTEFRDSPYKLDVGLNALYHHLHRADLRPPGVTLATVALTSVNGFSLPSVAHVMQLPRPGRPQFRLPGTSGLSTFDHTFPASRREPNIRFEAKEEVWMLNFSSDGYFHGVVLKHSRMREIQEILNASDANGTISYRTLLQAIPFPQSWVCQVISPSHPSSVRYVARYDSPSNLHPPIKLRLTVPNESGYVLQKVPVRTLKDVYGILEIIREQCWINQMLNTVEWIAEEFSHEADGDTADDTDVTTEQLNALLKGTLRPRRIVANVVISDEPQTFASDNSENSGGIGFVEDMFVPGLPSISTLPNLSGSTTSMVLTLSVRSPDQSDRSARFALRYDRNRHLGIRLDVNIDPIGQTRDPASKRPSAQLMMELEEKVRRGGLFGAVGRVWAWADNK